MVMPQVAIEYVIMVPVLIAQIFLFPYAASIMMNTWVESRRSIALQEVASHLSSSMQQLYSSINHDTITVGTTTFKTDLPVVIENYPYTANASLRTTGSNPNGSRILEITVKCMGIGLSTTASATFGNNMQWRNSTFMSNSTSASIVAQKMTNGTIQMYFG
jgi:hypothetical protein